MPDPERLGGTQDLVLDQVVDRLRNKIARYTKSNCFLCDQPVPQSFPSGDICCTVSVGDGSFDEGMFDAGGYEQLSERFHLIITPYVSVLRDNPPHFELAMQASDRGLIRVYKPKILRAMLVEQAGESFVAWEPTDGEGRPILRNQLRPVRAQMPRPTDDGQRLGMQITFEAMFDWHI
jgi:hypothetical protein